MKDDNNLSGNQLLTSVLGASNRPSSRSEFKGAMEPQAGGESAGIGSDSIPFTGIPSSSAGAATVKKKTTKLSRAQLVEIEKLLTARDHAVLQAIKKYRFLTSDQIGRLYLTDCSTKTSRTRNQNLLLQRLSGYGLIAPLARRVGGYGGGSTMQIWHLTEAGMRLLVLNDPGQPQRKRFTEPSTTFIEHTLAIAECAVQLICLCRGSEDLTLELVDTEPTCWRRYRDGDKVNNLKPDLFAITGYDGYEDRWFIEMDLGSEPMTQILDKCNAYLRYYYTGIEQKATEMFPLVVWLVKDADRKEKMKSFLRENLKEQPKMFLVITPDELEKMIRQFIGTEELC